MRLGMMVGPERGRYATKVDKLIADAQLAEEQGFSTVWIPQIPDDFDALTAAALVAANTSRVEIGTAVVPIQPRHPIVMAHQALSVQAVAQGRLALGLGVSHHWVIDEMLGLPYEKQAAHMRAYLEVLAASFSGPGMVTVENDFYRVNNPMDITDLPPMRVMVAALGPVMLRLAGERSDGTILWMADERAVEHHVVPNLEKGAAAAGRPMPRIVAGIPVCLCADDEIDAAKARTNRILSEAETSPNYQKLLDTGDAMQISDILAVGSEAAIEKRLRAFADAGVTDVSIRVVPIGNGREELIASSQRTRAFLSSLASSL